MRGEIYVSSQTYGGYDGMHYAIFYSSNNGETMTLEYENVENQPGVMWVSFVLGDATPGVVYNQYTYGMNKLWVSFDYGVNWEYRGNNPDYTHFFSGVNPGLIFKGNYEGFFKSIDYGLSFELLPITVICPFTEVGFIEPEFFGIYGEPGVGYNFVHSVDYGQTYTEIPIDSSVAFWQISGIYPQISRGTEPGELYLVSWWPDYHYKIFHSIDTGYSWTLKFESGFIDLYDWSVKYLAGRQSGSFYVFRSTLDPTLNHRLYYIDYSEDYGETFITYFHELDSIYTSVAVIQKTDLRLSASPNPFSDKTNIVFSITHAARISIKVYNVFGALVEILFDEFTETGEHRFTWSPKNLSEGIYYYSLEVNNEKKEVKKMILLR
ncbi:MAG: T9SS type A sorting domain-containing protein [Bacteroidetes bacterium]|nr:T9SS type A sorting domain-containing protein [Bacteroidota bacterium]